MEGQSTNEQTLTIDISNYAVGNYLIKVVQQNSVYQKQFVKE